MKSKKIIALLLVLVFIVAVFSACGQQVEPKDQGSKPAEQENKDADTKGTDSGAKNAPKELKKVKFVLPRTIEVLEDTPFWTAIKLGYFAEEGLDVQMEQSFGTTDVKMVATGNAQFAAPSPNFILTSIENGVPIKAVLQYDAINIFGMAVRKDSGIKTWADMKGKKVALGDASWELIINPTLLAAGLDPAKDIEYVVAGENRAQMVQEGKLDILFTWIGEVYQLMAQGFDFTYIDGNEILKNCSNPIVTSLDMIKNDPETVKGFCRALAKAMYFVYSNPEAGADISCGQFPAIDISWDGAVAVQKGRVAQMFGTTEEDNKKLTETVGKAFEDKWQLNVDWAVKTGIIKNPIPLNEIYTNEFIDSTWDKAKVEADAKNYKFKVKDKYK